MNDAHAFAVFAHTDAAAFGRLCGVLARSGVVVAHIDAKADEAAFRKAAPAGVRFAAGRVDVTWGTFSMVDATISVCRLALGDPNIQRVTILSGLSHPIVSDATLAADWGGREWIAVLPAPDPSRGKAAERFEHRYVGFRDPTGFAARLVNGAVRRFGRAMDPAAVLGGRQLAAGSQWWSLTRPTLEAILRTHDSEPALANFFRRTLLPDESYFQTLALAVAPDASFAGGTTLVRWDGGPHPSSLTESFLDEAIDERRFFFARKLGSDDARLVAHVEAQRAGNPGPIEPPGPR